MYYQGGTCPPLAQKNEQLVENMNKVGSDDDDEVTKLISWCCGIDADTGKLEADCGPSVSEEWHR